MVPVSLSAQFQHANFIIDAAPLSTHSLSERLREVLPIIQIKNLKSWFESFGFKYGIPLDADSHLSALSTLKDFVNDEHITVYLCMIVNNLSANILMT